jgi:hypothetical protein
MRPTRRRPRAALAWSAALFAALQLAFFVVAPWWHPDREFTTRLNLLRDRLAEAPGRPLVLMVGSSRTVSAFRPEVLPPLPTADGRPALVFNFAHTGAGPVLTLVEVQRLFRLGVRPRWLLVELTPVFLAEEWAYHRARTATLTDLGTLVRYTEWRSLAGPFLAARSVPWYRYRGAVLDHVLPGWSVPAELPRELSLAPLGGEGRPVTDAPEVIRRHLALDTRNLYAPALQRFHVPEEADRASRELAALCRREGVGVAFVLVPEGPAWRGWYGPGVREQFRDYCGRLSRECGAPLIDAQDWLDDADFSDSHHAIKPGAEKFTRRLGEVLGALLR